MTPTYRFNQAPFQSGPLTEDRPRRRKCLAVELFGLGMLLAGCSEKAQTAAEGTTSTVIRNVLLVTVDTLRADALGAYGYERATSPKIDAFASSATVFERAYATSSWTLPSLASLMTSTYPSTHRTWKNHSSLSPVFETLGEGLARMGLRTGAISSHIFLREPYGLHQGIEDHDEQLVHQFRDRRKSHEAITSPQVTSKAVAWIDGVRADDPNQPWFLWAHYFDPHNTYKEHAGITEAFGSSPRDLYDGEVRFTDKHIGALLDHLDETNLAASTIVVLVADHGEEFGEHGGKHHRRTLFDEVLRVPLLMRVPDAPAHRVDSPVSVVDVAPTIFELMGSPPSEQHIGRSLVPTLYGRDLPHKPLLGELAEPGAHKTCVIEGQFKLVWNQTQQNHEWYDLSADPDEQHPLDNGTTRSKALLHQLQSMRKQAQDRAVHFEQGKELELSEKDISALKSLGYGGGDDQ